jgi:NAD(P)-dependent dehydrogenase (short-subunit alcohol dehydrogenase family)
MSAARGTALVTGANRGLGLETCRQLAQRGRRGATPTEVAVSAGPYPSGAVTEILRRHVGQASVACMQPWPRWARLQSGAWRAFQR